MRWILCLCGLLLAVAGCQDRSGFPSRPGIRRVGQWAYAYSVHKPNSSNEIRTGRLFFGRQLVQGMPGMLTNTAVGRFKYFDTTHNQGWLNTLAFGLPVFSRTGDELPHETQ